jgi:glycosyltransferase involved in cell wall biosynthesis
MIRILHLLPRLVGGGPERSVLALAKETAAQGIDHRHTLVALDAPVTPRMVLAARRVGAAVVVRPDPAELRALATEADVVQVHYWNHPDLLATLRTVELPPARVVVWSRVLGTTSPQVLTAEVGRYADRLVCTSELSRTSAGARAALASGRPVEVIPGVADMGRLEGFTPQPHEGCVVGYLGVVNDAKMHPRFAELCAAVTHPGVRFVVHGGGGGEATLQARLEALGQGGRVELCGPTEDVRWALAAMDVFGYPLAPHTSATSEKALQEAMWVGLAPVVFPHGGIARLVEHEVTGLVATTDEQYVAALERLADDPVLRSRLGEAARAHARVAFDPTRWARVTVALVEELMDEPRRSRPRLAGGDTSAAGGFVAALGDQAGPFAVSLGRPATTRAEGGPNALEPADAAIAASDAAVAHGEGGIVHHRNRHPEDPHLRLWSGLVAAAAGRRELAEAEYEAAAALGLGDDRPMRYRTRPPEG